MSQYRIEAQAAAATRRFALPASSTLPSLRGGKGKPNNGEDDDEDPGMLQLRLDWVFNGRAYLKKLGTDTRAGLVEEVEGSDIEVADRGAGYGGVERARNKVFIMRGDVSSDRHPAFVRLLRVCLLVVAMAGVRGEPIVEEDLDGFRSTVDILGSCIIWKVERLLALSNWRR
ncbi:uncharacterized protein PAC_15316 [Phialocephala subalpina]|uniref:Uncharacterized protein n=1 Tax=Phialocephala subalpina TaxID=576137 RepID=A0A1L7XKF5_9HELO|nr:uncharacterized protein PAC_15316 [Phialocephala subalpina]